MTAKYDKYSGHGDPVHQDQAPHEAAPVAALDYAPVNTAITHTVVTREDSEYSTHMTFVIGPQKSLEILPLDPNRYKATMWVPVSGVYVVLCDSLEQAQSSLNFAGTTGTAPTQPQGSLLAAGGFKLEEYDQEPLWVTNADPTATAYVSVLIERAKS